MMPQFLSRFDTTLVLGELTPGILETIFVGTKDSIFEASKRFFERFKIELWITDGAKNLIARKAALQPRVGTRALKDVYNRVIKPFEFDPFQEGHLEKLDDGRYVLTLTEELVQQSLG